MHAYLCSGSQDNASKPEMTFNKHNASLFNHIMP
jgi:hypothetical protein